MKSINILFTVLLMTFGCKELKKEGKVIKKTVVSTTYTSFGEKIKAVDSKNSQEMSKTYASLLVSDTLKTKFSGTVIDVCQSKGCWMKVKLDNNQEAMVIFKDYGFFVPKDIRGKEVFVGGLAYIQEMSVEDQKHYAKDAGKSKNEIAKITEVKKTYTFQADGVLLKK